jgi:DNA-binding NarL/FixJ family response regulator
MQRGAAPIGSAPGPAADPGVRLSPRELEVARAVAEGRSNREIADQFGITERTVKAHLGAAFDKTGARDRLQLALYVAEIERDRLARTRIQGRSNELRQA